MRFSGLLALLGSRGRGYRVTVLFVCTANVCRSPLAQAMLRTRLKSTDWASLVDVQSAGTRVESPGRAADPRLKKLAMRYGFKLGRTHARRLTESMVRNCDRVYVMEQRHAEQIAEMVGHEAAHDKVRVLGSEGGSAGIPDPYFGDWRGFEQVYDLLEREMPGVLEFVRMRLAEGGHA